MVWFVWSASRVCGDVCRVFTHLDLDLDLDLELDLDLDLDLHLHLNLTLYDTQLFLRIHTSACNTICCMNTMFLRALH